MSEMNPVKDGRVNGRVLEFFHHDTLPEWGYTAPQEDTFAVIHPKNEQPGRDYPLYVVFHSAGHDVYSVLFCIQFKGNHDIYHAPDDMYSLILDCRAHENDWWWGGIDAHGNGDPGRAGVNMQPVEKRCIDTIQWVFDHYPIDTNRVYAVGNSMGGSGALGIALNHGDIFAALKVNVPAGVRHAADRCCLDTVPPEGFTIPDPPIAIDYSAQNDTWSAGHEILYRGMNDRRYQIFGYWGAFGHANDDAIMETQNDLIHSFPFTSVRKNEAYPVFTNASSNDPIPWPDNLSSEAAGQINAFFRWTVVEDSADRFAVELRLLKPEEWSTRFAMPEEAFADVLIRRLQNFTLTPGEGFRWAYGEASGTGAADNSGHPAVDHLSVSRTPMLLVLTKG